MNEPWRIALADELLAYIQRSLKATGHEPNLKECIEELGGHWKTMLALWRLKDDGRYPIRSRA